MSTGGRDALRRTPRHSVGTTVRHFHLSAALGALVCKTLSRVGVQH
eukprot:SAG11_NODE_24115_length_378_cov_0.483871_1_plen_45_part_10